MKTATLFLLLWTHQKALAFAPPTSRTVTQRSEPRRTLSSPLIDRFPKSTSTIYRESQPLTTLNALPSISEDVISWTSMGLLAVQDGITPSLQKKFVSKKICRSTILLAQEAGKFAMAAILFFSLLSPIQRKQALLPWSIASWWQGAAIPAFLYAVQNYAKLISYQHLSPVAYSVLNQTKIITAALFCYLLIGIKQSPLQLVALFVLVLSTLVMEGIVPVQLLDRPLPMFSVYWKNNRNNASKTQNSNEETPASKASAGDSDGEDDDDDDDEYRFTRGVLPLLLANITSGFAAAWGQRAIQRRSVFLYGMELSSASFLIVLFSLLWSQDGERIRKEGWTRHWNAGVWIPIAADGIGGQLVGAVTKYAGSVRKGFASIFGVLLSGIFQKKFLKNEPITKEQIVGTLLACFSLWMHTSFPP